MRSPFSKLYTLSWIFLLGSIYPIFSAHGNASEQALYTTLKSGWFIGSLQDPFAITPLQHGGRIKPMLSFASEMAFFVVGKKQWHSLNALEMLLSWMALPEVWESLDFIQAPDAATRAYLELPEKKRYFSPLFLREHFQRIGLSKIQNPEPQIDVKEAQQIVERLEVFHWLVSGKAWTMLPHAPQWLSLMQHEKGYETLQEHFLNLLSAYRTKNKALFFTHAKGLYQDELTRMQTLYGPSETTRLGYSLWLETWYQWYRPFFVSAIFYGIGMLLLLLASCLGGWYHKIRIVGLLCLGLGFIHQVLGFIARCYIAQRPPVTNMYESVLWVSTTIMVFAFLLWCWQKFDILLVIAAGLSILSLIAADAAPTILDSSIKPLVPVLRSNYWLTIHVLTITLSYGAFALSYGLARFNMFCFILQKPKELLTKINTLIYRSVQMGVILIAAGTILGGIWADYSWGRFWGWDPKEVWALIVLLSYVALLHGRYTNWLTPFRFCVWTAISFLTVLMAWYGVNFVLGAGLHSYGFASGGQSVIGGIVVCEGILIGLGAWGMHRINHKASRAVF